MYKHILIPTDGSALSEKAIRQGVALAKSINAKVTVLTVLPRFRTLAVDPFVMAETPDKYE
jgi:nucleotide-binding universal stress UspA family protein